MNLWFDMAAYLLLLQYGHTCALRKNMVRKKDGVSAHRYKITKQKEMNSVF